MSVGIIQKAKAKVANTVKKAAGKAGDAVATAGQLSPKQIAQIDVLRENYLKAMPNPSDEESKQTITRNLGAIGIETFREYLPQISKLYLPVAEDLSDFDSKRVCSFDITRWVTNKEEKNIDKLINVYQVLADEDCAIALIYTRYPDKCAISLAVVNNSLTGDTADTKRLAACVQKAIDGNFPGSELNALKLGTPDGLTFGGAPSVAVVSNLATEKSEDFVSQSMEKLLDGFVPSDKDEAFSVVLLAQPIQNQEQDKCRLYEMYSALSSFATWQTAKGVTESAAIMASANAGVNAGVNFGSMASKAVGVAETVGKTIAKGASNTIGGAISGAIKAGIPFLAEGKLSVSGHYDHTSFHSESTNQAHTESHTDTTGTNQGINFGVNFTRSSGITQQLGQSETTTLTFTNYAVKHTLELLEEQMKRLEQCAALGMWDFAAYVISPSYSCANDVAHMYLSLTQGEKSYMEQAAINIWQGNSKTEANAAKAICESLSVLQHPAFCLNPNLTMDYLLYPSIVTATTMLSGSELAHALNFPEKSVSGLPVLGCVPFGREVRSLDMVKKRGRKIELGHIYHMHKAEPNVVALDKTSLASHTFITGSTGAGKSNTVYHLLDELDRQRVNFLVIEPAKGEYKNVFGGRKNISVYGTNVKKAPLLRLNPFSFPEDTHVLEHIDRLVEIFNVCWPMYAAMPAVLKDAVEQAYRLSGWDLTTSINASGTFPTFNDLLKLLPEVVQRSGYSADTQNDYIGALYTRIKSLTNGINGQIFCSDEEIPMEKLFDENVIVDLSRVGSMETKSLLMGVLVLKLQEHRMAGGDMNVDLRHVTVLEEAHNLLRRTSDVQTQDSSNLQGKSVEMIANAIAEMRTYGEGFIIADQAPGLVDPAVIRNTNTKIIMRLPDESDRELVGKAASLNDDQIVELTKLPLGVAAVYQNDWLEPVLCKIDEYRPERQEPLDYIPPDPNSRQCSSRMSIFIGRLINVYTLDELTEEDVDKIADWIDNLAVGQQTKSLLTDVLYSGRILEESERRELLYRLVHGSELMKYADCTSDKKIACAQIEQIIAQQLDISERIAMQIRMEIFLYAASRVDREHAENQYQELLRYGGVR